MKKLTLRFLSLFLCLILLAAMIPAQLVGAEEVPAEQYEGTVARQYEASFSGNYYDRLTDDTAYAYKDWANNLENQNVLAKGYRWGVNMMTGTALNTNAYVDYLTHLLTMMDASFLDVTATQASYNAKLSGADIASSAIGTTLNIAFGDLLLGRYDSVKNTYELVSGGAKFAELGIDVIKDVNQLIVYSGAAALHNQKVTVLETIRDNTDDKRLKEAAEDAIQVCNLELIYICDNYTVDFVKEAAKFDNALLNMTTFKTAMPGLGEKIADGFASWLKQISAKSTSGVVKKLAVFGGYLAKNYKYVGIGLTIGTELGKLIFGSEYDLFREGVAMDKISDALITGFRSARSKADGGDYQAICDYGAIGKALTVAHLRGDYCYLHSVAGKYDHKADPYYEAVALNLSAYAAALEEIFIAQPLRVVHEEFELYNGFIVPVEQKTEVPEGWTPIRSYEDLKAMSIPKSAKDLSQSELDYYRSVKGIVMEDFYLPDGYESLYIFYGELDGNGHMIHNVSKPLFYHMFGGTVRNLGLVQSCDITYDEDEYDDEPIFYSEYEAPHGALVAYASRNKQKDQDCVIDNCYSIGSVKINVDAHIGTICVGGLVGCGNGTTFTNCYNEAEISVNTDRDAYVGGIVANGGVISNSYNRGDITVKATGHVSYSLLDTYAGGIAARDADAENCYNMGDITVQATDGAQAGGIIGIMRLGHSLENKHVVNCYNSGDITATCTDDFAAAAAGGITSMALGTSPVERKAYSKKEFIWTGAYIVNCMNTGRVEGRDFAGGITGRVNGTIVQNCCNTGAILCNDGLAGGIAGYISDNSATATQRTAFLVKCYNAGSVSGKEYVGSLIGVIFDETNNDEDDIALEPEKFIIDCYYLESGLGPHNSKAVDGVTGLFAEEMANQDSFPALDFGIVWKMEPESGFSYPTLRYKEFKREDLILPSVKD